MQQEKRIRIETFGGFRLLQIISPQSFKEISCKGVSASGPVMTFLKVLIAAEPHTNHGSRHQASKDRIIDALWPEENASPTDVHNALANAKSAVNRMTRTIIDQDLILLTKGSDKTSYQLNGAVATIDADDFDQLCNQASEAEGNGNEAEALSYWEAACALVQGDFLPDDQYNEWSRYRRERLVSRYQHCLHRLSTLYLKHNRGVEVIEKLYPYVLKHPAETDLLIILLPLLVKQQRHREALKLLSSCKKEFEQDGKAITEALLRIEEQIQRSYETTLTQLSEALPSNHSHQNTQQTPHENLPEMLPSSQIHQEISSFATSDFSSSRVGRYDLRFAEKLAYLLALVEDYCGQLTSCLELQEKLGEELNSMQPKADNEYTLVRRQLLITLATLPTALLLMMLQGRRSAGHVEQLLTRCAASISACWHLMRGNEYAVVEEVLPTYLPLVTSLAQETSKMQCIAASLATQGYRLKGILALHRNEANARDTYFRQAVYYAEIAQHPGMLVAALISWAYHQPDPRKAEQLYQRAILHKSMISPLQRSRLYAELSIAYAQQNREDEALHYLSLAAQEYPEYPENDPSFLYAEFSPSSMALEKGRVHLALTHYHPDGYYPHQAWETFAGVGTGPSKLMISERIRYEIINYQAETALALQDRDLCSEYVQQGVQGARLLGSNKRHREVLLIKNKALKLWPHDRKIQELKYLF